MIVLPNNPIELIWNATCLGCTDPLATNYDPTATVDDGSCQYPPVVCAEDAPTNLSATNVIQNRATINWII